MALQITHLYATTPGERHYFWTAPLKGQIDPERVVKLNQPLFLDQDATTAAEAEYELFITRGHLQRCGKAFSTASKHPNAARHFDELFQRGYEANTHSPFSPHGKHGVRLLSQHLTDKAALANIHPEELGSLPVVVMPDDLDDLELNQEQVRGLADNWLVLTPPEGSTQKIIPLMVVFRNPAVWGDNQTLKVAAFNPFASVFGGPKIEEIASKVTAAANLLLTAYMVTCQGCIQNHIFVEGWVSNANFKSQAITKLRDHMTLPSYVVSPHADGTSEATPMKKTKIDWNIYNKSKDVHELPPVGGFSLSGSTQVIRTSENSALEALFVQVNVDSGIPSAKMMNRLRKITGDAFSTLRKHLDTELQKNMLPEQFIAQFKQALETPGDAERITSLLRHVYVACGCICSDLFVWAIELVSGGFYTFTDLVDFIDPLGAEFPELTYYVEVAKRRNEWLMGAPRSKNGEPSSIIDSLILTRPQNLVQLTSDSGEGRVSDRCIMAMTCRYLIPETRVRRVSKNADVLTKIAEGAQDLIAFFKREDLSFDTYLSLELKKAVETLRKTSSSSPKALVAGGAGEDEVIVETSVDIALLPVPAERWEKRYGLPETEQHRERVLFEAGRKTWGAEWPMNSYVHRPERMSGFLLNHDTAETPITSNTIDRDIITYMLEALNPASEYLSRMKQHGNLTRFPYVTFTPAPGAPWFPKKTFVVGNHEGLLSFDPEDKVSRYKITLMLAETENTGAPFSPSAKRFYLRVGSASFKARLEEVLGGVMTPQNTAFGWHSAASGPGRLIMAMLIKSNKLRISQWVCQPDPQDSSVFEITSEGKHEPFTLGEPDMAPPLFITINRNKEDSFTAYVCTNDAFLIKIALHASEKSAHVRKELEDVDTTILEAAVVPGSQFALIREETTIKLFRLMEGEPILQGAIDIPETRTLCFVPRPNKLRLPPLKVPDLKDLVQFTQPPEGVSHRIVFGRFVARADDNLFWSLHEEGAPRSHFIWLTAERGQASFGSAGVYIPAHKGLWIPSAGGTHLPLAVSQI